MANFCEGCPVKGACVGEIDSMQVVSSVTEGNISDHGRFASISVEYGNPIGPTNASVRYRDSDGGASDIISVQGSSGADAQNNGFEYIDSIGRCPGPKIKKFLGVVVRRECSAPEA